MKDTMVKHDNFLADSVRPRTRRLSYLDGFRFGFGFFISGLLIMLILSGLAWAIIMVFHLH
jgi:uncharacterized iron-regulated membrane protein